MPADVKLQIGIEADTRDAVENLNKSKESVEKLNEAGKKIGEGADNIKKLAGPAIAVQNALGGLSKEVQTLAGVGLGLFEVIVQGGATFGILGIAIGGLATTIPMVIKYFNSFKVSVADAVEAMEGLKATEDANKSLLELANTLETIPPSLKATIEDLKKYDETIKNINNRLLEFNREQIKQKGFKVLDNEELEESIEKIQEVFEEYNDIIEEINELEVEKEREELEELLKEFSETQKELENTVNVSIANILKNADVIKKFAKDADEAFSLLFGKDRIVEVEFGLAVDTKGADKVIQARSQIEETINIVLKGIYAQDAKNAIEAEKRKQEEIAKLRAERIKKQEEELKKQEEKLKKQIELENKIYAASAEQMAAANAIIAEQQKDFFDKMAEGFNQGISAWGQMDVGFETGRALFDGLNAGIQETSNLLYQYGEQIAGVNDAHLTMAAIAEKVAKAMIKTTLMEISQIAIKKGAFYIYEGLAKIASSLWPPNPAGIAAGGKEVAAGLGMAALGGGVAVAAGALTGGGGVGTGVRAEAEKPASSQTVVNQTVAIYGTYDSRDLRQTERFLQNAGSYIGG